MASFIMYSYKLLTSNKLKQQVENQLPPLFKIGEFTLVLSVHVIACTHHLSFLNSGNLSSNRAGIVRVNKHRNNSINGLLFLWKS